MNLTSSHLDNVEELKLVTATSTYGLGLLTHIVYGFCNIFGLECNMYKEKIEKAQESATEQLIQRATYLSRPDGIMNISYQVSGMTVFVSGVAYKLKQ
ncbi:MAG: heavy metal-binding domain-containing protein [Clostridia bacterium]|nr:heavy metal-binding domain-containing protein [Clostridia bacterium]